LRAFLDLQLDVDAGLALLADLVEPAAKVSRQASTVNSWRPMATIGKLPRQRSLTIWTIGAACQACSPGARHSTTAASLSCRPSDIGADFDALAHGAAHGKAAIVDGGRQVSMATRGAHGGRQRAVGGLVGGLRVSAPGRGDHREGTASAGGYRPAAA
jgi:hypothetical protein